MASNEESIVQLTFRFVDQTGNAIDVANKLVAAEVALQQAVTKTVAAEEQAATKILAARSRRMAAVSGSQRAEVDAAAAVGVMVTATDRVVTSFARAQQIIDRVTRSVDPFAAAVRKAQKDVDDLSNIIRRGGEKAAEAAELLVAAKQKLLGAQVAAATAANDNGVDKLAEGYRQAAAATRMAEQGLEQLTSKYAPATASARAMTGELAALNAAVREGLVDDDQNIRLQGRIAAAYDLSAAAAQRAAEAQAKLRAAAAEAQARLIDDARAQQNTANSQQFFNTATGVQRPQAPSARESAAFFQEIEDAEKAVDDASLAVEKRIAELTKIFDPATASAKQMTAELAQLTEAQRLGINIIGGYAAAYQKIIDQYDTGAQAAQRAAEAQAAEARATAEAQAKLIGQGRAESATQTANDNQAKFNQVLGVDPNVAKSARDSAAAFEEAFAAEEKLAAAAQKLRDQLDPVGAVQRALNAQIAEYSTLLKAAKITQDEHNAAIWKAVDAANAEIRSLNGVTEAERQAAQAKEKSAAAAQKLRDQLDPVAAAQRQFNAQIAEYSTLAKAGEISTEEQTAANKMAAAALTTQVNSLNGVAEAERQAAQAKAAADRQAQQTQDRLTASAQGYLQALNPLLAAQAQYQARIASINEVAAAGLITDRQRIALLGTLVASEAAVTAALEKSNAAQQSTAQITKQYAPLLRQAGKDLVDFSSSSNKAFGLNRIGFLELQAAAVNAVQSLAAGISPLRTLETEGAQVLGALVQGLSGLGEKLKAIPVLLWPVIAAVTAVIGVFVIAALRVAEVRTNLRDFQIQLDTVAKGTPETALGLQKVADKLVSIGFSAADAKKAIIGLTRLAPEGLNPTAPTITKIATIGQNAATVTGATDVEETLKLGQAIAEGTDAVIKYALALGALQGPVLNAVRDAQLHRTAEEAIRIALDDLDKTLAGKHKQSLSQVGGAYDELRKKWHDFVNALAESPVVNGILDGLAAAGKGLLGVFGGIITFIDGAIKGIGELVRTTLDGIDRLTAKIPDWVKGKAPAGTPPIYAPPAPGENGGPNIGGRAPPAPVSPELVASKAGQYGFSSAFANAVADIESSHGANLGSRGNVYQLGRPERASIGVTSLGSATDQVDYGLKFLAQERDALATKLGRQVTDAETYLAHQQGPAGAAALISNPNTPAGQLVPAANISGNRGDPNAPAHAFVNQVTEKVNRGIVAFGGTPGAAGDTGKTLAAVTTATKSATAADEEYTRATNKQRDATILWTESDTQQLNVLSKLGVEQRLAQAHLEGFNRATAAGITGKARDIEADRAQAVEQQKINYELANAATLQEMETKGTLASAQSYSENAVEGLKSDAMLQAQIAHVQTSVDTQTKYNEILRKSAADALTSGAQQLAALNPVITATTRLAEASKNGTAAEHEAELQNQAVAQTQDAVNKALATGNEALIASAKNLEAETLNRLRANEAAKETLSVRQAINNLKDQGAVTALQIGLTGAGATSAEIAKQTSLLQAQQHIKNDLAHLSDDDKKAYLATVAAVGDLNIALEKTQQEQQRINDLVSNIAQTIESSLTQAISDAFDGKKPEAWGDRIRAILKSLVLGLSDSLFIKPLLGTITSALGFNQVAQQFGTFGGGTSTATAGLATLASLSGIGGGGGFSNTNNTTIIVDQNGQPLSAEATAAVTPFTSGGANFTGAPANIAVSNGGSVFSLGNLSNVAGLVKNVGGSFFDSPGLLPNWLSGSGSSGGGLFGSGGFSGFLNEIGGHLGFATNPALQGPTLSGATLGEGSVFGSTTFGSFLGGAGAGFGAGTLLNSLLGGNQTNGTIGSGLGSLAGAAIGSIIPGIGTLIGGLIGGAAGGGLGGLIGPKPSNFASGDVVNLSTGAISDVRSSGVQQNDQTVQTISSALGDFTKNLSTVLQGTGGSFPGGSINVQAGSRDGIKTSYSGPLGNINATFADAQSAITGLETAIIQNLSGITGTLRTVLDHVTDPADLQDAIAFAKAYDQLAAAANNALSGVEKTADATGPYAQALDQLNTTFQTLTDKANKYGVAIDPITTVWAEATQQLKEDYLTNLDALSRGSTTQFLDALRQIHITFEQLTSDAKALGLTSDAVTAKIARIEQTQAQTVFASLRPAELQDAASSLATSAPELAQMAQDLLTKAVPKFALFLSDELTKALSGNGNDFLGALTAPRDAFRQNIADAQALGLGGDTGTIDQIRNIQTAQAAPILDQLTVNQLKLVVTTFADSAPDIAAMAQALLDAGTATQKFNENLHQLSLAVTDPIGLAVEKEQQAGNDRLRNAEAAGADLTAVTKYNTLALVQLWDQAGKSVVSTATDIVSKIAEDQKQLNDPVGFLLEQEQIAGQQRLEIAKAAGADLVQVEKYNADQLEKVWKDSVSSIQALRDELTVGASAGLTPAAAVVATTDVFRKSLAKVQGGDTAELPNLVTVAKAAYAAATSAYGNGPITAKLRDEIVAGLDSVLNNKDAAVAANQVLLDGINAGTNVAQSTLDVLTNSLSVQQSQLAVLNDLLNTPAATTVAAAAADTTAAAPVVDTAPAAPAADTTPANDNQDFGSATGWIAALLGAGSFHAAGTASTAPGPIVVGEKGPEWMLPANRGAGWMLVGQKGPELINQPGGAVILPHGVEPLASHPSYVAAFAEGTPGWQDAFSSDLPQVTFPNPSANLGHARDSADGIVAELKGLRGDNEAMRRELAALRKQTQAGQIDASGKARVANTHLGEINRKVGNGVTAPPRRAIA